MDNLYADEDEGAFRKLGFGGSLARALAHTRHRRTKSATDGSLGVFNGGILDTIGKDPNDSHDLTPCSRNRGTDKTHHERNSNSDVVTTADPRISLENDIKSLHSRLQQEKSMRVMLERAMGRASSTLSPGHRHFASQTKELIAEIELLEDEVANREQHVLTLYRSIFEHCVSRSSSEQSSGIPSPAHKSNEGRKQPSVISNTFCSSIKFPLQTLQALSSKNNSGRKTQLSRNPLLSSSKEKTFPDCSKVHERRPSIEKTPVFRTLKDHLYWCPNKLSEEMVRYMAAVYCWLRNPSAEPVKNGSSLLSRSPANVIFSQHGFKEVDQGRSYDSMVEIYLIPTNKGQFSRASYAISNYRVLVEQLEWVNMSQMEGNAQTAFWINVYNSLVMHAYLAYGIPQHSLRRLALFHKAAYNVGGHVISADAIEQFIFHFHPPRTGWWLDTIFSTAMRKKFGEEKQIINSKFRLQNSPPLACFALCTGAFSDPQLRIYTASNVLEELEVAKREFLGANVVVKRSKVWLPRLLEMFAREASMGPEDLLGWVAENVDPAGLRESVQKCNDKRSSKRAARVVQWLPYKSRFRYVLSKDLVGRGWRGS